MGMLKKILYTILALYVIFFLIIPSLFPTNDYEANLFAQLHASYSKIVSADQRVKSKTPPRNIAVIGGGIGGSSTTYFLRHLFNNDVQIDLYESSGHLCGRLATIKVDGREYESGASVMHPKNYFLSNFREMLSLDVAQRHEGRIAVFDGNKIEFESSSYSIITIIKMFRAFALDIIRLHMLEGSFINNFINVYKILSRGHAFTDTEKLLSALDPSITEATQESANATFHARGIHGPIINQFATGGLRNNYGQDVGINGFVGLVSMAGIQPGLWSVKGGNKLLCDGLVMKSNTKIRWETVKKILLQTPSHTAGRFVVETEKNSESYDVVILTSPQIAQSEIDISEVCDDHCQTQMKKLKKRQYRQTTSTFVKGKLNSTMFKCTSVGDCPIGIFTNNKDLFYRSIGLHVPVDYNSATYSIDEVAVYKVFSTDPLSKEQINHLFESHSQVEHVTWKSAYPYYSPPDPLDSFVLNEDGLYYTSPIEWAASTAEMSVLSGKNSANLAYNQWYKIIENINSDYPMRDNLRKFAEKEDL